MNSKESANGQASSFLTIPMPVGVALYKPDQWQKLRAVSVDRDKLEDTYVEWMQEAERVIKELRRQGLHIVKVDVNIEELVEWCQKKKI